ncbi:hypothetical protein IC582_016858 [Cucumis melo]
MQCNLRELLRYGFAQSTRFWSFFALDLSIALLPVRSSKSTTPKLYTSLFVVKCPTINIVPQTT